MIRSLQVEGTCLQVSDLNEDQLKSIYQAGYIQNFVLSENLLGKNLKYPYFQLIDLSQVSRLESIQPSEKFLGYILKTKDTESLKDLNPLVGMIDLEISNVRRALRFCQNLNPAQNLKIFLSLKPKSNLKVMNEFVLWLEKNQYPKHLEFYKKPYEIETSDWKDWAELENFQAPEYVQAITDQKPRLSVVIPHYESRHFVTNTLRHLSQIKDSHQIEALLIDDGSQKSTLDYIKYSAAKQFPALQFKIFVWPEKTYLNSKDKIFRAGNSRNWGAQMARSDLLLFLDSDMLVPTQLLSEVENSLKSNSVVQFKRLHIPYYLSNENVNYQEMLHRSELFIEEASYWSQLFESSDWMQIQDYWKMTCTYALAIHKSLFFKAGRFRRHYIRYGFEDTDLGFRLSQMNCQFYLNKMPLLHLTQSQENTQSFFYKLKKMNRIQKMAQVFYLSNLDPQIYRLFHSFY